MNEQNISNKDDGHKAKVTVKKSGNEVIDRIYELEKAQKESDDDVPLGHWLPDMWHHVFVDKRGRPHHLAMEIFAEIWFRYRPLKKEKIFSDGSIVIQLVKAFDKDRYQFNRAEMAHRLNVSEDAVSAALTYLVKLGVIDRKHEDTDFNHRGFRNVVYVIPIIDRLLNLVAEVEKKVNKFCPNQEIDENAENTERREVGDVTCIMGATLPASGRNVPGITPPRSPDHAAVSRRSSEKSSASGFSAAEPPSNPEAKQQQQKSSASPPAPPDGAGVDLKEDDWEAPPPKPSGKDGKFGNLTEQIGSIRYHIGKSYKVWYGKQPDMPAKDFEDNLNIANQKLEWNYADYIVVIRAGWLWALDSPEKEPEGTFIPGFFSKECAENLRSLFKQVRKDKKPFLWHLREELKKQAQGQYAYDLGSMTGEEADCWWEEEMLERKVLRDPNKFYDLNGREISDPSDTTWTGIRLVLDKWLRWNESDREPDKNWLDAVIQRFKREPTGPKDGMHQEDYSAVKKMLVGKKLLSADFGAVEAPNEK
ncbi:MAG: hypothetical protein ACLQAH_05335 [Limisphaerales bacterium]